MFDAEYYSVAELAEILKVSPATIRRKRRNRELPPLHRFINRFRGSDLRRSLGANRPWHEVADEADNPLNKEESKC